MDPQRKPTIIIKFKNPNERHTNSDNSDDDNLQAEYMHFGENSSTTRGIKKKKIESSCSDNSSGGFCCQVHDCAADLTMAKRYHQKHKVCEVHAKASMVVVAGVHQRFCQQCSRFHEVSEFDDQRRSCRNRLAGHNERRRKSSSEATDHIVSREHCSRHQIASGW
uniref:squamosa promoter-binding protein 1-like n=1 Tax=Erigeron canadensis TaxID=72917 RepID=UPI001CB8DD60|nr:squamosa promoter-binding protein 1-like [Erigeron canadensis]